MSTPYRSRSSTMGSEGYFNWRESMEKWNAKFPHSSHEIQSDENFLLACQALLNESSDYTRVSIKMRHDRRSQLSDAMRARLGP
ncbi:hypothetical protein AAG906_002405 [Vitis piasezkii]